VQTEGVIRSSEDVVSTVNNLVHQGNVRRIATQGKGTETLPEVPLVLGCGHRSSAAHTGRTHHRMQDRD